MGDLIARLQRLLSVGVFANMGLRAGNGLFRFALIFLMTRELPIHEVGVFALAQSIIAPMPAVLGFGISYILARQLVSRPRDLAGVAIRDKIVLTVCIVTPVSIVIGFVAAHLGMPKPVAAMLAILCVVECISYDFWVGLTAFEKPMTVNFLVFLRGAAWVPLVVALDLLGVVPLSLPSIFACWTIFSMVSLAQGTWTVARTAGPRIWTAPFSLSNITQPLRPPFRIYLLELANAVLWNCDRYIASLILGLGAVGVYAYYWSFGNAAWVLVSAAIIQPRLPRLVQAWSSEDRSMWLGAAKDGMISTAVVGLMMCAGALTVAIGAVGFTGNENLAGHELVGLLVCLNQLLLMISASTHSAIYAAEDDRFISALNITALFMGAAVFAAGASFAGLAGLCLSTILVNLFLLSTRYRRLHSHAATATAAASLEGSR